jgi:hypothetical protein
LQKIVGGGSSILCSFPGETPHFFYVELPKRVKALGEQQPLTPCYPLVHRKVFIVQRDSKTRDHEAGNKGLHYIPSISLDYRNLPFTGE